MGLTSAQAGDLDAKSLACVVWAWGKLKVKEKDVGKDMLYDMFVYRDYMVINVCLKLFIYIYVYICNISNAYLYSKIVPALQVIER